MRKIYTILASLLMLLTCSTTASAGTIVGKEDNSTPFYGAFSDNYTIESGKAYHFQFQNWGCMQNTWNNWHLVARNLSQGFEYFVLRSDNYFWGGDYFSVDSPYFSISQNFDWTGWSFQTDMNGAMVDMIVKYEKGKYISMDATISTLAQKTYKYSFRYKWTEKLVEDAITVAFTVDNSHLEILTAEEYVEEDPSNYEVIGNKDFSTGYLGDRTVPVTLSPGQSYQFKFINHNNIDDPNLKFYENWIFVASQGGTDKVVLRADNYEIMAGTSNGCYSSYYWERFSSDYNGATVTLTVTYTEDNIIKVRANAITAEGEEMPEYSYNSAAGNITGLSGDISIALSLEHAWLEIIEGKYVDEEATNVISIGSTDFSTPYLGSRSDPVILSPGKAYQYTFANHNKFGEDPDLKFFENWLFVASQNGSEKVVLRADNYETVAGTNSGCYSNYNWDTFSSDYNGALVTLTATYTEDNILKVRAKIMKGDGTYLPDYTYDSAAGNITNLSGDLIITLSVEHAWLEILDQKFVEYEVPVVVEGGVGATDFTTPYLGASTVPQTLSPGKAYRYNFINHNDLTKGTPNNWIITLSQNDAPIAVVRADNWEVVNGSNEGFESAINWDTFMSDLHDANVTIDVNYTSDNVVTILALTQKASSAAKSTMKADAGITLPAYSWSSEKAGITFSGDVQVALSVDNSWVEVLEEGECEIAAIRDIQTSGAATVTKTISNGKLLIKTASGTYNAVGAAIMSR